MQDTKNTKQDSKKVAMIQLGGHRCKIPVLYTVLHSSHMKHTEHETLVQQLKDPAFLQSYKEPYDNYKVSIVPKILGGLLVSMGTIVYGKKPSYQKFKAVEVIARIPYQSWEVASYMFLTGVYSNESKAIALTKTSHFSREAQDNETMHVVVISQIVQKEHANNFILHTLIPLLFSLFYFFAVFILYVVHKKSALELNYVFESHAFSQYDMFIKENEEMLKQKSVSSAFLDFYGRKVENEYDLFLTIRNDELIHRNQSVEKL